ncbi:unnamed protein product [Albugo candida]|uniref:Uncharacterized protein n=1 Tax=Albugo candida TaxID=65357 RepID=A0A024GL43_9STRA|nr:unnamed protein product [Albugo candida]|eukprot:CCI47612.1 unnamed protein product [Albugo candida]
MRTLCSRYLVLVIACMRSRVAKSCSVSFKCVPKCSEKLRVGVEKCIYLMRKCFSFMTNQ